MAEAVAEVGSTANNYQILARLAAGGMAEIFLARGVSGTGVERYCVLKRILRDRASDVSFVRMFLDEARLAAQLQHPNVAQVYDIGKLGDSYFFTMEYVHGETVRAILQRARSLRREIPLASVLTIVAGAAAGLHHAHDRIGIDGRPLCIVHRDVSPANLMVSYEGTVKVVDFGVAKASDRAHETRSGTVKGKISYLSPEQARGASNIDRRSDLFSLGIVLWELLTTERLYKRSSDFENMTAIVAEPPVAPSSRRPGIPREIDEISLRLLAKDPAARFQSAAEVVEALELAAARAGSMLSASTLSRFLREMFGQRPEPWVELDVAEVPEGVTVTSEPIPSELALPIAGDLDLRLAGVPRLAEHRSERELSEAHPQPAMPTGASALVTVPGKHRSDLELLPTVPQPLVDPRLASTLIGAPVAEYEHAPSARATSLGAAVVPPAPVRQGSGGLLATLPGTGPQARPALPSAQLDVQTVPYPRDAAVHALESDRPHASAKQLLLVIGGAAVIGSLTMWLVMRGASGDGAAAPADAAVLAAEGVPVAVPPEPPPERSPEPIGPERTVVIPPDAAVAAPPEARPRVAITADAAVAAVDPDIVLEPGGTSPGAGSGGVSGDRTASAPPRKPDKRPPPRKSALDVAMAAARYPEAVGLCKQELSVATAASCTIAACHVGQAAKARSWFAKVERAKRRGVTDACKQQGVDLVPPRAKPDPVDRCAADPMACQR